MREIFAFLKFAADTYFCRFFCCEDLHSTKHFISYNIKCRVLSIFVHKEILRCFFFLRKFPIMFIITERFRIL